MEHLQLLCTAHERKILDLSFVCRHRLTDTIDDPGIKQYLSSKIKCFQNIASLL